MFRACIFLLTLMQIQVTRKATTVQVIAFDRTHLETRLLLANVARLLLDCTIKS